MGDWLRKFAWVLGAFVVFDVLGVGLTLLAEGYAGLHRVWEVSTALGYVVWAVTGVFCAVVIYGPVLDGDPESPEGLRQGSRLVQVTAGVAVLLAGVSSLFWSSAEGTELVAPDHRGVTLTYLATVPIVVAWARYVLFRPSRGPWVDLDAPAAAPIGDGPLTGADRARIRSALKPVRLATPATDDGAFRPARFWGTLAYVLGVPLLLFLDVSFFLLGPFDVFDRWTDLVLGTAVLGGLAWGFAAARREAPRTGLMALHAPLIIGAIFYFFALLLGGLLVAFGLSEWAAGVVATVAFWIGFLCGGAAIFGWVLELLQAFRQKGAGR